MQGGISVHIKRIQLDKTAGHIGLQKCQKFCAQLTGLSGDQAQMARRVQDLGISSAKNVVLPSRWISMGTLLPGAAALTADCRSVGVLIS